MKTVLLLIALCVVAQAQTPTQAPAQNPCAVAVAAAELQTETKALRLAGAEKEIATLRARLNEAGNNLVAEQGNSASLATKNTELASKNADKDQAIVEHKKTIAVATAERDKLERKIAVANRRWNCRRLHLGCIGER